MVTRQLRWQRNVIIFVVLVLVLVVVRVAAGIKVVVSVLRTVLFGRTMRQRVSVFTATKFALRAWHIVDVITAGVGETT